MKTNKNLTERMSGILLLLGVAVSNPAWAGPVTMPAGSTVWMELRSASCDNGGSDSDCTGSNQLGANGLPLATYSDDAYTSVTGSAEMHPDQAHAYLSADSTSFLYLSMLDTYTVHGTASGPFTITVNLDVEGTASTTYTGGWYRLIAASVGLEIGTWNPSSDPATNEQFRVEPFNSVLNSVLWQTPTYASTTTPFSTAVNVSTSYTRTVNVGDVFDIAYGINPGLLHGTLDLRNTALLSIDLPEGVYVTSAQGGTFGATVVPVPAAAWLFGSGLLGLLSTARRRRQNG